VIVANHRSSVDPFFIQVVAPRAVHWMVAREYCEHWAFRWFLRTCEVIPVSRGGIDTAATKQAIRLARGGGLIGMLPEGRINMTEEFMLPARPGAAAST
jgi:1-acyl-sn-glycerol-3-phosphate acyltransferase